MQLSEKKLKELIKESVVEALKENEVYKIFISECIKNTFELISEQVFVDTQEDRRQIVKEEDKVRSVIKNKNSIRESRLPPKNEIINEDIRAAQKMFESEFGVGKLKQISETEEAFERLDDSDILKMIGVKK
jgi:5'-deoxynucleotidase YfbR-like HD superfamily hydrolase